MASNNPADNCLERLNAGDEGAAAEVFHRFVDRLIGLARVKLQEVIRGKEEPEDVVQSVFRSFFRRQRDGQFTLDSWENVWNILAVITVRKCGNRIEYFRAARRDVEKESSAPVERNDITSLRQIAREPTPEEAMLLTETLEQLMCGLRESDREVLSLHLQDYTVSEISERVAYSERTVWRALRRIRKRAGEMLADCGPEADSMASEE